MAAKIGIIEKTQTEWSKEPEFDDKAFKKKRQDILSPLNNKDTYKSKDSTLEKHNIMKKKEFGLSKANNKNHYDVYSYVLFWFDSTTEWSLNCLTWYTTLCIRFNKLRNLAEFTTTSTSLRGLKQDCNRLLSLNNLFNIVEFRTTCGTSRRLVCIKMM